MFDKFKKELQKQISLMQTGSLFVVDFDKERIWNEYLNGFPTEDLKQEHNCNCCKSFLRQWGGIVSINNNKIVSIWDSLEVSDEYRKSVDNLKKYIHSLMVVNLFATTQTKCGTDKNYDAKADVVWQHFYFEFDRKFKQTDIGTYLSNTKANKEVLQRSLDELTKDSVETVLELIGQNSLYRGIEFKPLLTEFQKLQKLYEKAKNKDLFCWENSITSASVSRIRNTAIGTLLIDLSGEMELDQAVTRFEKVVAPTNYKRTTALVTPKMVEQARQKLKDLGLLDSLERRYARSTDLSIEDILFTDKSSELKDIFNEVSKESKVNPKSLTKIEEIPINQFIENVIPNSKSIEVLVENRHLSNLVSLITADKGDPLFKWNNKFSWAYTGGITDSIKERVKNAGGNIDGILRGSLSWYNYDDLDLHCREPNGNEIFFANKKSTTGGYLDVDMNAGGGKSRTPVENIAWGNIQTTKEGVYTFWVNNFCQRETRDSGFALQFESNGEIFDFSFNQSPKNKNNSDVISFTWTKKDGIVFTDKVKSSVESKEKWGVNSNTFVKVKQLLISPNHWKNSIGNKHYMFMLENCVSDENLQPFFNEFLKQELNENRKVFEIIANKLKIDNDPNQLSGLGFSETQRNSVIVRVEGNFKRLLKVVF